MLNSVGRGLAPGASIPFAKKFFLTCTLPPEITFERNSAATVTNANGKLVSVSTHQPRFDHNSLGHQLGLLIEGSKTNKCTNFNANPTATTGFTTAGTGTLSVVDDSTELAAAGLELVCTSGKVFKAIATTAATFTVEIPGTCANTNKHSASLWARGEGSGGTQANMTLGAGTTPIGPAGENYSRFLLENQTPDSSSRKFTLVVEGNQIVYFILNQLEENAFSTSVILTTGSSATRQADRPYIANLDTYPWFDENEGYIAARYYLPNLLTSDSYVAVAHNGATSHTVGLRMDASNHDIRAYLRVASVIAFGDSNDDIHVAQSLHAAGISWNASTAILISGGKVISDTITQTPTGLNRLDIGARNGGASPLFGHVQMLEVGSRSLNAKQLGAILQRPSDIVFLGGGQSLIGGHFSSQESLSDGGKQRHRAVIGPRLPEKIVVLVDGSLGASAACKTSNEVDYWWDMETDTAGPALNTFYSTAEDNGITPTAILWAQGERDCHYIGDETPLADYKPALLNIFTNIRAKFGPVRIFLQRIGRRTTFTNPGGIQAIRNAQQELIDNYDWIYDAAEIYDLGLYDQVHLDDAGYVNAAERSALQIIAAYDGVTDCSRGPIITAAERIGTTVTVTLSHDSGTDFTPTSGIEGFKFFDETGEISISSATRVTPTTIEITLSASPVGLETLYYGYDDLSGLTPANVVRDNGKYELPLRTTKIDL